MFLTALIVFLVLLVIAMIIYAARQPAVVVADPCCGGCDSTDETVVTTTTTAATTTTDAPAEDYAPQEPQYDIVGEVARKKAKNGQFYVIDPVDKAKIYVNITDDLYRDAEGKVWKLA